MDLSSSWDPVQPVQTLPCMVNLVKLSLTGLEISKWSLQRSKIIILFYSRIIRDEYPAVWAWIKLFEDLSGVDPDKSSCDNSLYLTEMLQFASDVYLPFLQANSEAVEAKKPVMEVTLWQKTNPIVHQQPTNVSKYQHKCYQRIKESFDRLSKDDKERANTLFSQSNCIKYL